jgi:hypothetical protein
MAAWRFEGTAFSQPAYFAIVPAKQDFFISPGEPALQPAKLTEARVGAPLLPQAAAAGSSG